MATFLKPGSIKEPKDLKMPPIDYFLNQINLMKNNPKPSNKIFILQGTTGSGKSTVVPVSLYKNYPNKLVISVQPRIFNAIEIPTKSIQNIYNDMVLGQNLGYRTGPSKILVDIGIMFMTFGSFQIYFRDTDNKFTDLSFVIIDEAHDNSLDSEIIHFMIKSFIKKNGHNVDCPIFIITSATIDAKKLLNYYETTNFMYVSGQEAMRSEIYLNYSSNDFYEDILSAIEYTKKEKPPRNDVLVFVSGLAEMTNLADFIKEKFPKIIVVSISRDEILTKSNEVQKINTPVTQLGGTQKIILITNIGETGITYKYVKFVIDTGFEKSAEYIPSLNFSVLIKKPISQVSLIQRAGRIGRIFPGEYIGIFSDETREKLNFFSVPEIYKKETSLFYLYVIKLLDDEVSYEKLSNLDFLNKPAPEILWHSIEKLYLHGFINSQYKLTFCGEIMLRMSECSIEQAKLIMAGFFWKVPIYDIIILAYYLDHSVKTEKTFFSARSCCDFLSGLEHYYENKTPEVSRFHDKCILILTSIGLNPYSNYDKKYGSLSFKNNTEKYIKKMKYCIFEALKLNTAVWNGQFYQTREGAKIFEIKSSALSYGITKTFCYSKLRMVYNISRRSISPVSISIMDGFRNLTNDFY